MLQETYVAVPFTSSQQQKPKAACCVRFTSDGLSTRAPGPAPERGSRDGFRKDGSSFSIGSERDRHGNGSDNRARAQQLKARLRLQKAGILVCAAVQQLPRTGELCLLCMVHAGHLKHAVNKICTGHHLWLFPRHMLPIDLFRTVRMQSPNRARLHTIPISYGSILKLGVLELLQPPRQPTLRHTPDI